MLRTIATFAAGALLALPLAASIAPAGAVQGGPSEGVYRIPVSGVCAGGWGARPLSVKVGQICAVPLPLNRGGGVDPSYLAPNFKPISGVYSLDGRKVALRIY